MDKLLEILSDLAGKIEINDDYLEKTAKDLIAVYSEPKFRHSYAALSIFIENELFCDQRDELVKRLDLILSLIDEKMPEKEAELKKIGKLCDHIQLESLRLNRMQYIEHVSENVTKKHAETKALLKEEMEQAKAINDKINDTNSQIITVLGIFAGLVITFTISSELGTETFKNIDELNFYKVLLYLDVLGAILYNTIFMMMYTVSKIARISIAAKCRGKSCDKCCRNHWVLRRLIRKYPYVFWMDVFFLLLFIFLSFKIA